MKANGTFLGIIEDKTLPSHTIVAMPVDDAMDPNTEYRRVDRNDTHVGWKKCSSS